MPNKTIYVRDEDVPLFDKIQADGGESMSARFASFLRFEVSITEHKPTIQVMEPMPTLRDQMAMVALDGAFKCDPTDFYMNSARDRVQKSVQAYRWADAMLEARKEVTE